MIQFFTTHPKLLSFCLASAAVMWLFVIALVFRAIWGGGNSLDEETDGYGKDYHGI